MHRIRNTLSTSFPALASRDFAIFWVGHLLSLIGTAMQNTAQPLLAYRLSGRPFDLGLIGFAATLPIFFLALPGGVLIEHWDKRKTIIILQVVMMLDAFVLAYLTLSGMIQIWHSTLASEALPKLESWFPEGRSVSVLDADYKTGRLASYAAGRGLVAVPGADWLVGQALPAYELFMRSPARGAAGNSLAALLSSSARAYSSGRKIALIGLMGAGKTFSGLALAGRLGQAFVDSDREIEAEAGESIAEIFASEGESGFRAREARIIDRITSMPGPAVIATGGGAVMTPSVAAMLSERCLVVWLYVAPKTAAARARGFAGSAGAGASAAAHAAALAARPLLAAGDPEARLVALEAERRSAYASCAELVVSTEGMEAEEAAEVIHDEIDRLS